MASESCASIIDWLSDIEASAQWEEYSLQDPSLPCATSSPQIHSTSSLLSSPCFITSQKSRKRKHHTNKLEYYSKGSYSPRKPLKETMSSPNKRARIDDEPLEDAQMAGAEQYSTRTPQKGGSTMSSSILRTPTASRSEPKTPSSTKKKTPSLPGNPHSIRDQLERAGMHCNDKEAFTRCPNFMDLIKETITNAPRSIMADTSAEKFIVAVERNYTQNEKTIFRKIQPLVVKIARDIASNHGDLSNGVEMVKRSFEEDGLEVIEDCNFIKNLLPLGDSDFIIIDKTPGLTDPRPDLTYGIREPDLKPKAEHQVPQHLLAYLSVAPGMRYPFYVEEHKSVEEGIIKAEHQAMRDGAVLVNARMRLNKALKPENWVLLVGPDTDSFVFSCAWTPDIAKLYVNWYEKLEDGGIFHMHKVGDSYRMDVRDDIKRLRHDIHNILDWGLLNFGKRGQQVWDDIVARYQVPNAFGEAKD